ncbi:flagellar hook protein FlgE [Psychrobium sp. 1_MG-2023]|uniref:flagellar hook protein FlgE n=1 Tax=Psychrobium sp. 1_MG-2023 TaxID=3062624 RepID=UPI000C34B18E|nr:flagellar hook protein FlgE [Psychrobium sp. 1_MG-2023]MDP2559870.1 flagellar hook protein FlgE [Psychrobium sp. 1_MG-2023]PKF59029.1 flagellar hook protein FlgE [Alteromonadales bacterium alter-6D02]
MSFNIALSGIAASKKDLDVTANNIANVNTIGFKESRAEFADVYASSLFTNSKTKAGDGATTAQVAQQFHQGSLSFTNNALDLAITGPGFFVTSDGLDSKDLTFTRAGAFKLNNENFIVDSKGNYLQTYPVNTDGTSAAINLTSTNGIQIPETAGVPVMSSEVTMSANLPANATAKDLSLFDHTDPTTYNHSTSITIYDSLGESHVQTSYFVKDVSAPNQWAQFTAVDGIKVDVASAASPTAATAGTGHVGALINFDTSGIYQPPAAPASPDIVLEALGTPGAGVYPTGADGTQAVTIKLDEPTQFSSGFEVTSLEQNGLTVGRLTGVEIGPDGLVKATYSNGSAEPLGRVAMARFRNEQGLTQIGNTSWKASQDSGEPLPGEGDSGTFGTINSAALEQANVDLTTELVDLITAQRNFQANSRALEVNQTLSQTILQIR